MKPGYLSEFTKESFIGPGAIGGLYGAAISEKGEKWKGFTGGAAGSITGGIAGAPSGALAGIGVGSIAAKLKGKTPADKSIRKIVYKLLGARYGALAGGILGMGIGAHAGAKIMTKHKKAE